MVKNVGNKTFSIEIEASNIGKKRPGTARPSQLENSGRNGQAQLVKPEIYNPATDHSSFWKASLISPVNVLWTKGEGP